MHEKRFGLAGFPLEHSFSPAIHNNAYRILNLPYNYDLLEISPDDLDRFLENPPNGLYGFNVTIPFKEKIFHYLAEKEKIVDTIRCCNTVLIKQGKFHGFNTDVFGINETLNKLLDGRAINSAAVFGAGGAAKEAVYTLSKYFNVKRIHIICREPETRTGFDFVPTEEISFCSFDYNGQKIIIKEADLIINCTPLGMYPNCGISPLEDAILLRPGQFVFDMVYNPAETKLLTQAKTAGAKAVNGLEMLLVQAAKSFRIFTDLEMPYDKVKAIIYNLMNEGTQT